MVLGIGVDVVEVERIEAAINRFGERFLHRVFHAEEVRYCRSFKHSMPHFAARFAAKEAISKAFGTGIGRELNWLDMEIERKENGAPYVTFHGGGQRLLSARNAAEVLISLSHTRQHAVATALLLAREPHLAPVPN